MYEEIQSRCRALARRAGFTGLPTAAVLAAVAVLGLATCIAMWRWWPRTDTNVRLAPAAGAVAGGGTRSATATRGAAAAGAADESGDKRASGTVWVHMVGAVIHPGVYELAAGKRVADAVDAAGGTTGNAAPEGVNLARLLEDGEQIAVPTQDQYAQAGTTASGVSGSGAASKSGSGASAGKAGAPPSTNLVDINAADTAALDTLPGIGPSTAAKIVADREANGAFATADDLGRVAGIGPKKLEQLKAYICAK